MISIKVKFIKWFEIIAFIYFLVGVLCGIQILYSPINFEIPDIVGMFYMYTIFWSSIVYLVFGCILYKHRNFLMNVIDSVLCFVLTAFYPYPVSIAIYDFNKHLYYFLAGCFTFLPIIFCIIGKNKIKFFHIFKTITRILMIMFIVLIILIMNSCSAMPG